MRRILTAILVLTLALFIIAIVHNVIGREVEDDTPPINLTMPVITPPTLPPITWPAVPPPITPPVIIIPLPLQIVSVTTPIDPGYYATLRARTEPYTLCTITVYYKSGPSEAMGLYDKWADSSGYVSWTWKVGTRTTYGFWEIVVTANSDDDRFASKSTYLEVR